MTLKDLLTKRKVLRNNTTPDGKPGRSNAIKFLSFEDKVRNRILNRLDVPVVEDVISFRGSSCTLMPFWMASALCDSPSTGKHLHPRYSTCESNMPSHQSTFFENREKCPKRAVKIFRSSVSEIKLKIIFKEKKWSERTKYYTEIKNKGKTLFFFAHAQIRQ